MAKSSAYKRYLKNCTLKPTVSLIGHTEKENIHIPEPSIKITPKKVKKISDNILKDDEILNITEIPEDIFEEE